MPNLLDNIDAFIATHGLSESQFGVAAVNDKNLVRDLRTGRRLWPETESRVRNFMATYRADAA